MTLTLNSNTVHHKRGCLNSHKQYKLSTLIGLLRELENAGTNSSEVYTICWLRRIQDYESIRVFSTDMNLSNVPENKSDFIKRIFVRMKVAYLRTMTRSYLYLVKSNDISFITREAQRNVIWIWLVYYRKLSIECGLGKRGSLVERTSVWSDQ